MKNKYFAYIFTSLLLVGGLIQNIAAQQGQISFPNGISVVINTTQNGENQNLSNIYASSSTDRNIVHRVMIDRKSKIYFGYDLEIFASADAKQFEVSVSPLTLKDVDSVVAKIGGLKDILPRSLPKYPGKINIQSGDTIVLDILENLQTKEKISDLIKITQGKSKDFSYTFDSGNPKDYTISDVKMSLLGFDAYINDEKVKFSGGGMIGSLIWIYFPNKGRFILSPIEQPTAGFQKIGLIDDKTITFNYAGINYKFVSNKPVLGWGGKWNLWVMFDENYKPSENLSSGTSFSFGAADKAEYLFDNK